MPRWQLVGLVEPSAGTRLEDFHSWYLDHHVEDTVSCPGFVSARVLEAVRPFAGTTPPAYITIYEVEAETPEEAERVLARYQRDPSGFPGRRPPNGSLSILGAGWYRVERTRTPSRP